MWLARAKGDRGAVRLAWRWIGEHGESLNEGREPVRFDVFPDQTYTFGLHVVPPRVAGHYVLELGLVSEWVSWFSEVGVRPLRLSLTVEPAQAALDRPLDEERASQLLLSSPGQYRSGESIKLRVRGKMGAHTRVVDAYLLLEDPDHALWSYDGQRFIREGAGPLTAFVRRVEIQGDAAIDAPLREFRLPALRTGPYRCLIRLIESDTRRTVAEARTTFDVIP